MSIVIPSRARARCVGASIATALRSGDLRVKKPVLDNISTDNTADIVQAIRDSRSRYVQSDIRLGIRDDFTRGPELRSDDDLGFLSGFEHHGTLRGPIVKSALRLIDAFGTSIDSIFPPAAIVRTMPLELQVRARLGRLVAGLDQTERAAGITPGGTVAKSDKLDRGLRLAGAFGAAMPIEAEAHGTRDILGVTDLLKDLPAQLRAARCIGQV